MPMSKYLRGVIWMLLSCLTAAIMVNIVRYLSFSMHPFAIVFYRNAFSLLLFLPWFLRKGRKVLKTSRIKIYFMRGFIGLSAMFLWFYSLTVVPLAMATALSFTAPLLSVILAIYFMKEKSDNHKWAALIVGFIGTLIILRPGTEDFNPHAMIVLCATIFWALSGLIIKSLTRTDSPWMVAFYMVLVMTPMSFPFALNYIDPLTLKDIAWLFALGLIGNIFQIAISYAIWLSDFSSIMPFDFTRLIFVAIISYFAFGEVVDLWTLIGAIVIMCSAVYAVHYESKLDRVKKNEAADKKLN